ARQALSGRCVSIGDQEGAVRSGIKYRIVPGSRRVAGEAAVDAAAFRLAALLHRAPVGRAAGLTAAAGGLECLLDACLLAALADAALDVAHEPLPAGLSASLQRLVGCLTAAAALVIALRGADAVRTAIAETGVGRVGAGLALGSGLIVASLGAGEVVAEDLGD